VYGDLAFTWFIQDNVIGLLYGKGVVSVGKEGTEQRWKEPLIGLVDLRRDRVRNTTRARGGRGRGFFKHGVHF